MPVEKIAHKVNHVALVIDRSGSMSRHKANLLKVADGFVANLKATSDALGHETRVSIYAFDHTVDCLVWDMDVHNCPSLEGRYTVDNGATALLEAAVASLDDLSKEVSQKYGDHLFLHALITDGMENASGAGEVGFAHHNQPRHRHILTTWRAKLAASLGDAERRVNQKGIPNWTTAILVPDALGRQAALEYGWNAGNIERWDPNSETGIQEAIESIGKATTTLLRGHDRGVSSTKNLFAVGQDLDLATVKSALEPIARSKYEIFTVREGQHDMEIRDFVQSKDIPYVPRTAFYELGSRVQVQANKDVLVYDADAERVFGGSDARELLFGADGRTNGTLSVKAGHNPKLKVLVMSGSYTRKLKKGTKLLVML